MRIIPTNKYLFKCNLTQSNLCDFCNSNIETVNHLFWECHYAQNFSAELKTFLSNINIIITFDLFTVTFGLIDKVSQNTIKNYMIICSKYFIFRSKYMKIKPCIHAFKNYLNKRIEMEKHIALSEDKLEFHNRKWANFIY